MLLKITTTAPSATDLGFLLHKHPSRVQAFDQAFGTAHVFYPEATEQRCTVALLLEVDPVKLVKSRRRGTPDFSLGQYVNDRPYAASSLLAVAIAGVFRTALRGRCDARPELVTTPLPLTMHLPACPGTPELATELFGPLGWQVDAVPVPLSPEDGGLRLGDSRYVTLTLTGEQVLANALNQLYVLLPVLDNAKHYWVAPDEVDKLIRAGEGWLAAHPARASIARRYLARRRPLVRAALGRLAEVDDSPEDALDRDPIDEEPGVRDPSAAEPTEPEPDAEPATPPAPLNERRIQAVLETLRAEQTPRVIDLGCGSGKLIARLKQDAYFERIAGVDVSHVAIAIADRRGVAEDRPRSPDAPPRVQVFQGALTYTDERFRGYDAAVLMEVIEHVDEPRLPALERVVFGDAQPRVVIVTTPNVEYNVRYEGLAPGARRHPDHRFEWTRAQFQDWSARVAGRYGYRVRHGGVGDEDPELGSPTQMGVFVK